MLAVLSTEPRAGREISVRKHLFFSGKRASEPANWRAARRKWTHGLHFMANMIHSASECRLCMLIEFVCHSELVVVIVMVESNDGCQNVTETVELC